MLLSKARLNWLTALDCGTGELGWSVWYPESICSSLILPVRNSSIISYGDLISILKNFSRIRLSFFKFRVRRSSFSNFSICSLRTAFVWSSSLLISVALPSGSAVLPVRSNICCCRLAMSISLSSCFYKLARCASLNFSSSDSS